VAGPEAGPERKWQGLGPALSIAGAATGVAWFNRCVCVLNGQYFTVLVLLHSVGIARGLRGSTPNY